MYKCTGLALMLVICAVFMCSCSGNDENNKQEESRKETIKNTEISTDSVMEETEYEDDSNDDINSVNSEIEELVYKYYSYLENRDVSGLNSLMIEPLPQDYYDYGYDYSIKYEIKQIYLLGKNDMEDCVLGIEYDATYNDLKTPATGLGTILVRKTADGLWYLDNSSTLDQEALRLVEEVKESRELKDLVVRINREYQEELDNDPELKQFMEETFE